jgi:hypothetical protein
MAEREPALVTPFWVRIAAETSLSPGWLLVGIPAVLYPTYLLLEVLFGRGLTAAMDFGGDFETAILPGWAIGLGYVSMMSTYVARGTFRDLEALRAVLEGGEAAYSALRQQLTRFDRRRVWIGCLLGIAFFSVVAELAVSRWSRLLARDWSLQATCIVLTGFLAFAILGRATVYFIETARLYARIGERGVNVDLLDLTPISPLTQHGLRIVLLMTLWCALSTVVWLLALSPPGSGVFVALLIFVCLLTLAGAAFLLPVRGLRRQIRARKTEELARVREKIRRDRELAEGLGIESAEAGARIPGLLAYKHEIESVREWPFDAPTLTRFFLYVAIPLGSWVGGALVERLLGAALD